MRGDRFITHIVLKTLLLFQNRGRNVWSGALSGNDEEGERGSFSSYCTKDIVVVVVVVVSK